MIHSGAVQRAEYGFLSKRNTTLQSTLFESKLVIVLDPKLRTIHSNRFRCSCSSQKIRQDESGKTFELGTTVDYVQGVEKRLDLGTTKRGFQELKEKIELATTINESRSPREKTIDMLTFGNLCVDVLVRVEDLPPSDPTGKWNYMQELMANPPDQKFWEAGGNANTLIAGSRLGLRCTALGHVGDDIFGQFFVDILNKEKISVKELGAKGSRLGGDDYNGETLVVWVMVDPKKSHAFCSRFDFNKDPVYSSILQLNDSALELIKRSKSFLINGFIFDEIPPKGIISAAKSARASKTPVLFDPGPRTAPLVSSGSEALYDLLRLSDVVMLTAEEAQILTKISNPEKAALDLFEICGENVKWVIIKRGARGCILATRERPFVYSVPGFKVEVADTVGCGDSFAAAISIGYSNGLCPKATIALANAVGAATAQGSGAGRNVAKFRDVHNILTRLKALTDDEYSNILEVPDEDSEWSKPIIGSPRCSSGIPLHKSIDQAFEMLYRSVSLEYK